MKVHTSGRLKWIDKFKLIGLVLLSCGLLVGCGEGTTVDTQVQADTKIESEAEMSPELEEAIQNMIPENVRSGHVTKEVYLEVIKYKANFQDYSIDLKNHIQKYSGDNTLLYDLSFLKEFKTSLDEYDTFLKGIILLPKTEIDFELNSAITDIISKQQIFNSNLRKFLNTGDTYYKDNAIVVADELLVSQNYLFNLMKKYGLL